MRRNDRTDFDVIVLGSGIAGSILAMILARHGFAVLVLDGGVHPRFVVGESTIPQTSQLISFLAREHKIPELEHIGLGSTTGLRENVTQNCGIKRVFGFAYHNEGQEPDPTEALQFGNIWRDETHMFRQDIDQYLMTTAVRYGAYSVEGVKIESVVTDDDGVSVVASGKRYTAKFVADGTGFRSVLADKLKLREEPCSLVSSTRSLFTHMVDVTPFEEVAPNHLGNKWSQGTLHHCFKRGWFWVIPFNNWEGAPNKLVSVGVTLDDRLHPEKPGSTPEEEFAELLSRFPAVERQFANAKLARPWVRTKRLQYFSTETVGKRWALLSHAAGFIDPLFSRGLINTMDNLRTLSRALITALKEDDFAVERFTSIDLEQKRNIKFADQIVAGAYIAWDDFQLWNAWLRLWAVGVHDTESQLASVLLMGKRSRFKPAPNPIASDYEGHGYRALFEEMYGVIEKYDQKQLGLQQAREGLWAALGRYDFAVPLPDGFAHQEWAMLNQGCRDIFVGIPDNHARWAARQPDPHVVAAMQAMQGSTRAVELRSLASVEIASASMASAEMASASMASAEIASAEMASASMA